MKSKHTFLLANLLVLHAACTAQAVDIIKANNTDPLNLSSSWVSGTPGTSDAAVWNNTVTAANTVSLGTDLSWGGIKLLSPGGNVTISAGNSLTLGSAGIDLSQSSNNRSLTLNNDVILGANQTWHTGGNTLTMNGALSGSGILTARGNFNSGNLLLAGDNSLFTGELRFATDGKVTLGNANALAGATVNLLGQRVGLNLTANNLAYHIGGLKGNVALNLGSGGGVGVSIGNAQDNEYWNVLSGSAKLIKTGAGTQTFRNALAHTGGTTISEGTLKLSAVPTQSGINATRFSNTTLSGFTAEQLMQMYHGQSISGDGIPVGATIDRIDWGNNRVILAGGNMATTIGPVTFSGVTSSFAPSTTIEVKSGAFLNVSSVGGFTLGSGQTLVGGGTVLGSMAVVGTLSPGSSPGELATGGQAWLNGGDYNWQVLDAAGAAGTGYDTISILGALNLTDLAANSFGINLWSLSAANPDANGEATNFDNTLDYAWTLLTASGGINGFDAGQFVLNTAATNGTGGFANDLGGGTFALSQSGNSLMLNFTAVPEPSALLLSALGLLALARRRR